MNHDRVMSIRPSLIWLFIVIHPLFLQSWIRVSILYFITAGELLLFFYSPSHLEWLPSIISISGNICWPAMCVIRKDNSWSSLPRIQSDVLHDDCTGSTKTKFYWRNNIVWMGQSIIIMGFQSSSYEYKQISRVLADFQWSIHAASPLFCIFRSVESVSEDKWDWSLTCVDVLCYVTERKFLYKNG